MKNKRMLKTNANNEFTNLLVWRLVILIAKPEVVFSIGHTGQIIV